MGPPETQRAQTVDEYENCRSGLTPRFSILVRAIGAFRPSHRLRRTIESRCYNKFNEHRQDAFATLKRVSNSVHGFYYILVRVECR